MENKPFDYVTLREAEPGCRHNAYATFFDFNKIQPTCKQFCGGQPHNRKRRLPKAIRPKILARQSLRNRYSLPERYVFLHSSLQVAFGNDVSSQSEESR